MCCGIVIADIDPERALERDSEGEFGLRSGKIDPAGPSGKACGLRKLGFDPERALRRGCRGSKGIGNADFAPEGDVGRWLRD